MKTKNLISILCAVVVFMIPALILGEILHVPDDFENIQAGIDAAEDGDTVLVEPGEYVENIDFDGKNIVVGSLFLILNNATYIDSTIINGDSSGTVVTFASEENNEAKLTGFTITNGFTNDNGGGIWCRDSNPIISDVNIRSNRANQGGGIFCDRNADITLRNANIEENYAIHGGGIYCYFSSPMFNDVLVLNNEASQFGGVRLWESNASLNNLQILNNRGSACGGVSIAHSSNVNLINVIIRDNWGGGVYCQTSIARLTNVLIALNHTSNGGGIYCYRANLYLNKVTICNNTAGNEGGGIYCLDGTQLFVVNTILWENDPQEIFFQRQNDQNSLTISYSDIGGGQNDIETNHNCDVNWLEGNFDANPLFVDQDNNDFHLTENSPCIDAGDPETDRDPDDTVADIGAYYFHQGEIAEPNITIEPAFIMFLDVPHLSVDSAVVTIRNVGLAILSVDSQTITPVNTPFTVYNGYREFDLEPDSSHLTWITFTPIEESRYGAIFRIYSNDPDENIVEIPITGSVLKVKSYNESLPCKIDIKSIYPNPFNSTTRLSYGLPITAALSLRLYDVSGRHVATLVDGYVQAGVHTAVLQSDDLASGIYFVRVEALGEVLTQKVLLVR